MQPASDEPTGIPIANAYGAPAASPFSHRDRARGLLKHHPELRALTGHYPATAGFIAAVGALQLTIAFALLDQPWWLVVACAYLIGAVLALAIWTLVHECTHDLVFRTSTANRWMGIAAGLPLIIPATTGFRTCHLLHHRHQGDAVLDGDVPSAWEMRLVGKCPINKAVWLGCGALMQALRPLRMKEVTIVDRWLVSNVALQIVFNTAVVMAGGWQALVYCLLSNLFALGLHPLGARWVQEHFVLEPGQDTYSYNGPMNRLVFNAGYHVEHHDLMRVAWVHLPAVRRIAPEFYSELAHYQSWTGLLIRFLRDRRIKLDQRMAKGLSSQ
jgi:sphingolipid 4-desaturase/C4-monooxygenase